MDPYIMSHLVESKPERNYIIEKGSLVRGELVDQSAGKIFVKGFLIKKDLASSIIETDHGNLKVLTSSLKLVRC